ncbi:MAG TPA: hypothetical protein VNW72_00725 [Chthoniobacterales bacterium]|jgi:hypothetical protein|nr:hypothetical protein [Chthoniobacterales bacterium]
MPNNSKDRAKLSKQLEELKTQLKQTPSTDGAKRDELEKKITETEQKLKQLDQSAAKAPIRPDWQFFDPTELVEMAIVGGGGALGGLIAYIFKKAQIWTFVPKAATAGHCIAAGALAAGLAVWFIARTDRNNRVPCLLFSILCGLAGLKMIEKAATTILPQVEIFRTSDVAATDKDVEEAKKATQEVQKSSDPTTVKEAEKKIEKAGDSLQDLSQASTKAKGQGDTSAAAVLDKHITEAAQSLTKSKLENQSIPEVSDKIEKVLEKSVTPEIAKTAEDKELNALREKYLKVPATAGWCFLGVYNKSQWDRSTTDYRATPDSARDTKVKVKTPVYLRDNLPTDKDYKLGEIINVLFEGDEITIADATVSSGNRVWAHVTQIKRAGTPNANQPGASPTASTSPNGTEGTPAGSKRPRGHSRKLGKRSP